MAKKQINYLFHTFLMLSIVFSQFAFAVPEFPMLLGMACPSHSMMQKESVNQSAQSEHPHHTSSTADNSAQANSQSASHSKLCQVDSCCTQCKCNTCGHCSATIIFSAFHSLAMQEIQSGILLASDCNYSPSTIFHPPRSLLS